MDIRMDEGLAFEISYALMAAVMFTPSGIIPFHTEPDPSRASYFADEANRTERSIVGNALLETVR